MPLFNKARHEELKKLDVPAFLERPEVAQFVGKNFDKMKAKWLKDWDKKKDASRMMRVHWNAMAFFFWFVWFAYRKMWAPLIGLGSVICAYIVFEAWYETSMGRDLSDSTTLAPQLVVGLLATSLYFQHIVKFFQDNPAPSPKQIARAGGTSMLAAIGGTIAYFGALVATAYISVLIFPEPQIMTPTEIATPQNL